MPIPPATEDTVYQIISGFYPEITSGPKVSSKAKGGQGSVGAKYRLVSGWNETSIARTKFMEEQKGKEDKQQFAKEIYLKEHKAATAWGKLTPKERKEAIKGGQSPPGKRTIGKGVQKSWKTKAHEEAGEYPEIKRGGVLVGEEREYYRWTGGSDEYRLYGDMVWYMYGERSSKDIEAYVKGFGAKTPKFNSIYSKSQGNLVKTAKKMANDIFNGAVDEVGKKLIKEKMDIWEKERQFDPTGKGIAYGEMAPEEMGFTVKVGNTEYMATPEAAETHEGIGKIAEGSMANVRDMVKVVDGKVVEVIDVTEEAITKANQHGIVSGTEEFDNLVKNVEKFKKDPKSLHKIKQAVVSMFLKNIEQYNPIIEKLQSYASSEGDKSDKTFEQILKKIKEGAKKKGDIGTPDIAKEVGFVYRKAAAQKQGKEIVDKAAMEYVVHMLGTMGGLQGAKFKQTHRVADYPPGNKKDKHGQLLYGQSLYAIVPMEQDPKKLIFLEPPVAKTVILAGYSATLAMAVKYDKMKGHEALENSRAQKQAWMHSRVTKGIQPKAGARYTSAENSLRNSAKHSTTVSAIAGPALEKVLMSFMSMDTSKFTSALKKEGSAMDKSTYYWNPGEGKGGSGKQATRLRKGKGRGGTMFWALPYIGIQQSEYTGKQ